MASTPLSSLPFDPPTRRFAPVLQFLTPIDVDTERQLLTISERGHQAGRPLERISYELTARALALGYTATIAMQEIASRTMPSFPGEEVVMPLLLIDLRPLRPRPVTR